MEHRKILHLDLDAFFCAVEEQHDPTLRGKAFAVGGSPGARGVVASCSYPARKFGVRSAMPMIQAKRLCPELIIVRWNHGDYRAVSKKVMGLLHGLTPLVEPLSIDEAFLDVSDLPGAGEAIARRIQAGIRAELDLPSSLGVATNKLVAKIANNIGKSSAQTDAYPNAITVVAPGDEASFLAPLPARELWGVGPKTAERLTRLGLKTIGDIAQYPPADLAYHFGKHGSELAERAKGIDTRDIETSREVKSVSREITYERDISDAVALKETLRELSKSVSRQLRRKNLRGRTIHIKLRWSDFTTLTRQTTLNQPIDDDDTIYEQAVFLLDAHRPSGKYVRLIGVGVSGFEQVTARQLGLWEQNDPIPENLGAAIDSLRARFGDDVVTRGGDFDEDELF
jgi:DNA polymerase-4